MARRPGAPQEFASLFRYFVWADLMRQYFDHELLQAPGTDDPFMFFSTKRGIFMTYWYGGLYVVIEGWRELDLHDSQVDLLLESGNVELLRRFRNGAFHYQRAWLDARLSDFCGSPDSVRWVRELTRRFGEYLTGEMRRQNAPATLE